MSYKDVAKIPKVGKKPVEKRDPERVVLVYPVDEQQTDAEKTKKLIKETLAPKEDRIQIRSVRKVTKGGVVVDAGNKSGALKIKEIARRVPTLRVTEPKKPNPRVLIYDVDRNLEEEEIKECIYKQNLEELGFTEEDREARPRREHLLEAGRVYIDFAACRVVDQLVITRCFRCQGYGHVTRVC